MTLQEKASKERSRLRSECETLEHLISALPDGRLRTQKSGKYTKWFRVLAGRREYIHKKNRDLAEDLAYKSFLEWHLRRKEAELNAVERFLSRLPEPGSTPKANHLSPAFNELIESGIRRRRFDSGISLKEDLDLWQNASFEKNTNYPERLNIRASSRLMVRSKSEAFIANALALNGVPFRYEAAFKTQGITLYPDFTIRHPDTGECYLWEHCGLIEKPSYQQQISWKLGHYVDAGFVPGENLIMTFETDERPISPCFIDALVHLYFV